MGVLIDTSLLIAIEREDADLEEAGSGPHAVSVITVSELLHGVYRADVERRAHRRLVVERLLAPFEALEVTEEIARVHAEIGAGLAETGRSIGVNDLWIGATALVHDLAVATRDRRSFGRIPSLRLVERLDDEQA